MTMDAIKSTPAEEAHTCKHCQVHLKLNSASPQPPFRIRFPHTISEAKAAAQDGCPIFKELVQAYSQRRLWNLAKAHLFSKCKCCKGLLQRLQYVARSLSSRPFHLSFPRYIFESGPEPYLNPWAHLDCGNGPVWPRFNAYTYTGNNAASVFPSLDTDVHMPCTIEAVKRWLRICPCTASSSGKGAFKPTRLLYIRELADRDEVTLMHTQRMQVAKYACLSYCWGGSQPVINTVLRGSASDEWVIPVRELPQTFKDAICTLRLLDFDYVWIDSLCIVQDDPKDKDREICQMPRIYKNASLTLCASTAQSCHDGFLHPRPDYSEYRLQVRLSDGGVGTVCLDRILPSSPHAAEPLGTRAWAYQERLLSPRLLEYGRRTLRWSCACCERYSGYQPAPALDRNGETAPGVLHYNLFSSINPDGLRRILQHRDELFRHWNTIVYQYTRRNLTFSDDRLAAISGLASEVEERTGVRYLAGLWDYERLPSFMLWRVVDESLHSPRVLRPRPALFRAPSWSWTAVDGAIYTNNSDEVVKPFKILQTEIRGGVGHSVHGSITVEGLACIGIRGYDRVEINYSSSTQDTLALLQDYCELSIYPDCAGELIEVRDGEAQVHEKPLFKLLDLTFIAIGRADYDREIVRGLLLVPDGEDHRRVGYFQARSKGPFSVRDWSVETFRII